MTSATCAASDTSRARAFGDTSAAASTLTSRAITVIPSSCRRRLLARPMPLPAPVTIATPLIAAAPAFAMAGPERPPPPG